MESPETKTTEINTLKEFLDENQKALAVAGVFMALGVFWKSFESNGVSSYISFLCFVITIPVFIEVRRTIKTRENWSWTLIIFVDIFVGIIALTAISLLVSFPNHAARYLNGIVVFGVATIVYGVFYLIFKKLKQRRYDKEVKRIEELKGKDFTPERSNIEITHRNNLARFYYELLDDLLRFVLFIGVIIGFVVSTFTGEALQALVDTSILGKQPMEISEPK